MGTSVAFTIFKRNKDSKHCRNNILPDVNGSQWWFCFEKRHNMPLFGMIGHNQNLVKAVTDLKMQRVWYDIIGLMFCYVNYLNNYLKKIKVIYQMRGG